MRKLRGFAVLVGLSLLASAIGIFLYLLPPAAFPTANRVADYSVVNDALRAGDDAGVFRALHVPAVDIDAVDPNIVLIKIDDESLGNTRAGLTAWPFPRSVYGKLLQNLHRAGAKAVAIDVDFLEPSTDRSQDAAFARGLRELPTVLPFILNTTSLDQLGVEPLDPVIAPYVYRSGYTTVDTPGGMLIAQPLAIDTVPPHPRHFLSFAAAAVEAYTGRAIRRLSPGLARFGDAGVPLSGGEIVLLPFRSIEQQYIESPVRHDINQRVGAEESSVPFVNDMSFDYAYAETPAELAPFVKGKLVLIGSTAQALGDFVLTPFGRFAGIYSNARFIDQLLAHKLIRVSPAWLNVLLMLALPLLLTFFFSRFKPTIGIVLSIGVIGLYVAAAVTLYAVSLYWVNVVHVAGAMAIGTLFVTAYRVVQEQSERRMVTNLFGMHVSPEIVRDILSYDDPRSALALEGKKVKATIFYSDIRGFTAMSENMSPEDIYAQLNEYFEEMCSIIFTYGGYVDKFIGDCVMAVFSAPYQTPDDAASAVRAAVAQQKKIRELAAKWKAAGKPEFSVGMGINTGDVVMGNLGARARMNYTVIGDNVNLAARLYNVAKAGEIIISDYTYREVEDFVIAHEMAPVTVKGKRDPVRIYNVLDVKDTIPATNAAVTMKPATA